MRSILRLSILITGSALLAACQSLYRNPGEVQKYSTVLHANQTSEPESRPSNRAVWDAGRSIQREPDHLAFAQEHRWSRNKETPDVCLALSGGGIRSAAFSIGVLGSLSAEGVLEQVDIISAVSGGGYAASWFYMQHYHRFASMPQEATPSSRRDFQDKLFERPRFTSADTCDDDVARHQCHLREHSRLFSEVDGAATVVMNAGVIPLHLLGNFMFSWRRNFGLPALVYRDHLRRTFHAAPFEEPSPALSMYELGQFARQSGLPAFLFNTTAWPTTDESELTAHDAVFSFSPLQYGSGAFGFYRYPDDPDTRKKYWDLTAPRLDDVVATSGAALDFNMVPGKLNQTLLSALAMNLGGYIRNPAVAAPQRWFHQTLPVPLYLAYRHYPDVSGTGIYLSDGGHVENLGVFPLLVRGCKSIIVVDGEEDGEYAFRAYFQLRKLVDEIGATLRVDEIEEDVAKGDLQPGALPFMTRPSYVARQRNGDDPTTHEGWIKYAANPVLTGRATAPGYSANVTYAKLAYKPVDDESDGCSTYPPPQNKKQCVKFWEKRYYLSPIGQECRFDESHSIDNYYYCIKQEWVRKTYIAGRSDPFPQQRTKDLNFSPAQFDAYVDLGARTGRKLAEKFANRR